MESYRDKSVRIDRHAKRRMHWRRISEEEVMEVLKHPDFIEDSIKGRTNAYKIVGNRNLKLTFKESPGEILIITVIDKTGAA